MIGEILPHSSKQHWYILTATDYFTRWVEEIPLRQINDQEVIEFFTHSIITRFGVPTSLVFDNATYFSSFKLFDFALENGIVHKNSTNYYPQGNGLAESTNKNLIRIIKKTLLSQQRNWHNALHNALWVDRVTPKSPLGTSPFFLVYEKEVILPPNLSLLALQLSQETHGTPYPALHAQIDTLLKLEEERLKTWEKFAIHQSRIKWWFDKKSVGNKYFEVGDLVLKWDKAHKDKWKHSKFQALWTGPFQIKEKFGSHTYRLQTLEGRIEVLPVNGHDLKHYFTWQP